VNVFSDSPGPNRTSLRKLFHTWGPLAVNELSLNYLLFCRDTRHKRRSVCYLATQLDWIEQCFTSPPTQYRLYGRRFLQVKRPNQQYQCTEGTNSTQTSQTYNKQTWTQNTASPLVYNNMGWLGDSSHRGQGCQACILLTFAYLLFCSFICLFTYFIFIYFCLFLFSCVFSYLFINASIYQLESVWTPHVGLPKSVKLVKFTVRCYSERGIATAIVCPSVHQSVYRLSVRNVEVSWSHRFEFFENNFTSS